MVYAPDLFLPLDLHWEVTSCLQGMYGTTLSTSHLMDTTAHKATQRNLQGTGQEHESLIPNLLHFNCINSEIFYESYVWNDEKRDLNKDWGHAVRYHVGYKFIWLNKGDGTNGAVKIRIETDLRFRDEKRAGKEIADGYDGSPLG